MTKIPFAQIDAFASKAFEGNQACVMPLDKFLPDATLQAIAAENNVAETAFIVADGEARWQLRWFTPAVEVDLCGHATLATGHVLFEHLGFSGECVRFLSRSGELAITREGDRLVLDFPSAPLSRVDPASEIETQLFGALGARPDEVYRVPEGVLDGSLAVFANEEDVRCLTPDFAALKRIGAGLAIVTAPGENVDFVSRFFAPGVGIDEDPVTGAAHCALAPYWAERLNRNELHARQISARGGDVHCVVKGERVLLGGRAVTYLQGTIEID